MGKGNNFKSITLEEFINISVQIILHEAEERCEVLVPRVGRYRFAMDSMPEVVRKYVDLLDLQGYYTKSSLGFKSKGPGRVSYYVYVGAEEISKSLKNFEKVD